MNYSVGMQRGVKKGSKFRVQSEIALFSVLQQHGRLSVSELAKRVNLARTAAYYAQKRLWARGLFDFRAVPRLKRFGEIPMMLLGFDSLKARTLRGFVPYVKDICGVRMLLHNDKSAFFFLMGHSHQYLNELSISISRRLGKLPKLSVLQPQIATLDLTIPASILETLYAHLPERRGR